MITDKCGPIQVIHSGFGGKGIMVKKRMPISFLHNSNQNKNLVLSYHFFRETILCGGAVSVIDLQVGVKKSLKLGIRRTAGMRGLRENGKPKVSNFLHILGNKHFII